MTEDEILAKLGRDVNKARRIRGVKAQDLAEMAGMSRTTFHKVERGDAGVAVGKVAAVLVALGLGGNLALVADLANDPTGRHLATDGLPRRVRS